MRKLQEHVMSKNVIYLFFVFPHVWHISETAVIYQVGLISFLYIFL